MEQEMLLSDAIMLGSLQTSFRTPSSWGYCAIGLAMLASGNHSANGLTDKHNSYAAVEKWPWLQTTFKIPDDLMNYYVSVWGECDLEEDGLSIVSWYFHMVCNKLCTLEHLVEWVRANEPKAKVVVEDKPLDSTVDVALHLG